MKLEAPGELLALANLKRKVSILCQVKFQVANYDMCIKLPFIKPTLSLNYLLNYA